MTTSQIQLFQGSYSTALYFEKAYFRLEHHLYEQRTPVINVTRHLLLKVLN
jgi:hypothetical protein